MTEKEKIEFLEWIEKTSILFEMNARIKDAERRIHEDFAQEIFRTYDDVHRGKDEGRRFA
jgi:hypothetical protein